MWDKTREVLYEFVFSVIRIQSQKLLGVEVIREWRHFELDF